MRAFRIVVASHGDLGAALLTSAELICGPINDARAVALLPEHSPEGYEVLLAEAAGKGPSLILADIAGGTPANVARVVARDRPEVVVVAGTNLGMVVEAALSLTSLDDEAIAQLVGTASSGIVRLDGTTQNRRSA